MMAGWTMGFEGWIWMGAWTLALVLVVWLLVREPHRSGQDEAMAILRARFARGEISEDEFRRATGVLAHDAPGSARAPRDAAGDPVPDERHIVGGGGS